MLLTMKAPANRPLGERTVRCNEAQANILRKIGWTDVTSDPAPPPWFDDEKSGSPQTIQPEPVVDPDEVRPDHERQGTSYDPDASGHEQVGRKKRKYHRRTVNVSTDGKVNYSIKPPKRQYRRRDMKAED
jgi:hypothetical protein